MSEHPELDISQAKIDQTLFIGHFPGLKAKADDAAVSTNAVNSKFVLVEGSGFRFNVMPSIAAEPTTFAPDAVGQGPNLQGANLQNANLAGTDFTGCNLEGANFARANLQGCNFTCANFNSGQLCRGLTWLMLNSLGPMFLEQTSVLQKPLMVPTSAMPI